MAEYLKVVFPERREVWLDGEPAALTQSVCQVDAGWYTVTLAPPQDFAPECQRVEVIDTLPSAPLIVEFTLKEPGP
ncbi:hypothetical protein IEI94_19580 [Halomonas sp. ML-15]|uniref:hypothetical protein n=1 Tax=Halomonas sp. ML-15 TaxID=2773305 RepID=UPI00174603CC|nr:hypothetical protein [Halomonas sp. ML-15]MBD3898059.1 hypothetical protein [Halomonas sp. ML-15]